MGKSGPYKRWILTRSTEYRPDGVLQVGQILADPYEPASALHTTGPLDLGDIVPEETALTNVTGSQASELSAHFGLWANLNLGLLGGSAPLGAGVDGSARTAQSQTWAVDRIASTIITPSDALVDSALHHGDVPSRLKRWKFAQRLFMVSGTRVVHGARMKTAEESSVGGGLNAQADLTAATGGTVPGKTGIMADGKSKESQEMEFQGSTDFVFAYRLQEIHYYSIPKTSSHKPFAQGNTAETRESDGKSLGSIQDEYDDIEGMIDEEEFQGDDGVQSMSLPGFEDIITAIPAPSKAELLS
jgi:hypothetical protein